MVATQERRKTVIEGLRMQPARLLDRKEVVKPWGRLFMLAIPWRSWTARTMPKALPSSPLWPARRVSFPPETILGAPASFSFVQTPF